MTTRTRDSKVSNITEARKSSHIKTTLEREVQFRNKSTGFDDVELVHAALPETDASSIELQTRLLGHTVSAPIVIESMTGGTSEAAKLNELMGSAAEKHGLAIGVGSQRAAIENPALRYTYEAVRKRAPTAPVFANLGVPQLIRGYDSRQVKAAVEMIRADAVFIHLNSLQEAVQVEGETQFEGVLERLGKLVETTDVPVLVKETGAGIPGPLAKRLQDIGIKGIDVAGAGGTSWAAVEYWRALDKRSFVHERLGETFWDWGIPTAASIVEVSNSCKLPIIASGGVRNGLHGAKSIALGASAFGLALPVLRSATSGSDNVDGLIDTVKAELRTATFLAGCHNIGELREAPVVLSGRTREWLEARGYDTRRYATRTYSRTRR